MRKRLAKQVELAAHGRALHAMSGTPVPTLGQSVRPKPPLLLCWPHDLQLWASVQRLGMAHLLAFAAPDGSGCATLMRIEPGQVCGGWYLGTVFCAKQCLGLQVPAGPVPGAALEQGRWLWLGRSHPGMGRFLCATMASAGMGCAWSEFGREVMPDGLYHLWFSRCERMGLHALACL